LRPGFALPDLTNLYRVCFFWDGWLPPPIPPGFQIVGELRGRPAVP